MCTLNTDEKRFQLQLQKWLPNFKKEEEHNDCDTSIWRWLQSPSVGDVYLILSTYFPIRWLFGARCNERIHAGVDPDRAAWATALICSACLGSRGPSVNMAEAQFSNWRIGGAPAWHTHIQLIPWSKQSSISYNKTYSQYSRTKDCRKKPNRFHNFSSMLADFETVGCLLSSSPCLFYLCSGVKLLNNNKNTS